MSAKQSGKENSYALALSDYLQLSARFSNLI